MSKWTNQQKLLFLAKTVGVPVALAAVGFCAKWGSENVNKLINEVNEDDMGIDNANDILSISNKLGPTKAKETLSDALSDEYDNVTSLRKRA